MRQPRFSFELTVPGGPEQVWARLWNLNRHTAAVPFTSAAGGPLGAGVRFAARTGVGRVGFDDVMLVREWDPPHRAVIDKVGRVLTGTIEVTLAPGEPQGGTGTPTTLVRWSQRYGATKVPDALASLVAPAVRAAYRTAVRRITRP